MLLRESARAGLRIGLWLPASLLMLCGALICLAGWLGLIIGAFPGSRSGAPDVLVEAMMLLGGGAMIVVGAALKSCLRP